MRQAINFCENRSLAQYRLQAPNSERDAAATPLRLAHVHR
jgi:hypothetical protein